MPPLNDLRRAIRDGTGLAGNAPPHWGDRNTGRLRIAPPLAHLNDLTRSMSAAPKAAVVMTPSRKRFLAAIRHVEQEDRIGCYFVNPVTKEKHRVTVPKIAPRRLLSGDAKKKRSRVSENVSVGPRLPLAAPPRWQVELNCRYALRRTVLRSVGIVRTAEVQDGGAHRTRRAPSRRRQAPR